MVSAYNLIGFLKDYFDIKKGDYKIKKEQCGNYIPVIKHAFNNGQYWTRPMKCFRTTAFNKQRCNQQLSNGYFSI
jgi:hypothetical protein